MWLITAMGGTNTGVDEVKLAIFDQYFVVSQENGIKEGHRYYVKVVCDLYMAPIQ